MMTKLMANLEPVIAAELSEANRNHPLFASRHDGAAVIREEVEEAEETMRTVSDIYGELWHDIKHDNYMYLTEDIQHLREAAKNLVGEAVQVAAMCDKWMLGRGDSNAEANDTLLTKLP